MRVSKAQQDKNRRRVVTAAAKLLRERGIGGIGVDALAKAAGMTHGGVYSHFRSKDALAAAAVKQSLDEIRSRWIADAGGEGAPGLHDRLVRSYLSRAHRDNPGAGCALAAIGPEASRHGRALRKVFAAGLDDLVDALVAARRATARSAPAPQGEAERDEALTTIATMLGAIVLSRVAGDRELSDRILLAARRKLTAA
jgi:TetR/AcrR family transcriptional repressor of nem operon